MAFFSEHVCAVFYEYSNNTLNCHSIGVREMSNSWLALYFYVVPRCLHQKSVFPINAEHLSWKAGFAFLGLKAIRIVSVFSPNVKKS